MKINTLMKFCGMGLVATSALQASSKRPNVLFILNDDQAPETLRIYGNKVCDTPNLDRLAEEGVVFTEAHHMGAFVGAVCTPSRHMIMCGRTLWHLPMKGAQGASKSKKGKKNKGKKGAESAGNSGSANIVQNTIGAVFNRAGYDTMRTCKKGNSYSGANQQFTIVKDKVCREGNEQQGSKWHGDNVMNFLEEREKNGSDKPFFIYYGFSHPHDPRNGGRNQRKHGPNLL
jgi:arylsulfatase A-like enzyme